MKSRHILAVIIGPITFGAVNLPEPQNGETIMKTQLRKDFQRFLECGAYASPPGRAACALRNARTLEQWREAESADLVRLKMCPENESYFDVFGEPDNEKERLQTEAALDRCGCWHIVAEVNTGDESTGNHWEHADSIGMCVYDNPLDPFENCYIPDLMNAALEQIPVCGQH